MVLPYGKFWQAFFQKIYDQYQIPVVVVFSVIKKLKEKIIMSSTKKFMLKLVNQHSMKMKVQ